MFGALQSLRNSVPLLALLGTALATLGRSRALLAGYIHTENTSQIWAVVVTAAREARKCHQVHGKTLVLAGACLPCGRAPRGRATGRPVTAARPRPRRAGPTTNGRRTLLGVKLDSRNVISSDGLRGQVMQVLAEYWGARAQAARPAHTAAMCARAMQKRIPSLLQL